MEITVYILKWMPFCRYVTELLGVLKWEIEEKVTSSGTVIGEFPYGITKTDELRV